MIKLGKWITKHRVIILIVAVVLLIPSVLGMVATRINYDMLNYLPDTMETIQGQDILLEDFGKGAFSMIVVEDMEPKDTAALKEKIEQVNHVDSVIWYDSLADISIPMEILPDKFYKIFNTDHSTMMAVFFDTSTSADETMEAINEIRSITSNQCFVSGMSAMVTDLKNLCEQEEPVYVAIAVVLAVAVMMLFMDSFLIPIIFLVSIGMAILYNLGSNYFLGEISYVTKALSAILQLGVTMDYSIFLWHSYNEQKVRFDGDKQRAMAHAISNSIVSVAGSSTTTVAGFLSMCFMSFTLGRDLGIVMAKGVVFGLIGCVTILPSLILVFDNPIEKTRHKPLMPKFDKVARFITKRSWIFLIVFAVLVTPAVYGYTNTSKYYDLSQSLPEDMDFVIANTKLKDDFGMSTVHMILADSDLPQKEAKQMLDEIGEVDGVRFALGLDSLIGSAVPAEIIPEELTSTLKSENYQLMLISSEYNTATDEVNAQISEINNIIKKYDDRAMLIGEAPCTKDLIEVTDRDFKVVDIISIAAIFLIIFIVFRSVSLPMILVAVIEFAIFVNLGIPFYTGTQLAFIAPICISTIQLGATVDYAILMTTRYKKERCKGNDKNEAVYIALSSSIPSIIVSALGFFAATFGVGLYSNVDMISSLCALMARGAIISMVSVILLLPAMLKLFDKVIIHTSLGFKIRKDNKQTSITEKGTQS